MHVLVTGSTGLIGSAVAARLVSAGHDVTAARRPGGNPVSMGSFRDLTIDISRAKNPEDWLPHLRGVDAVINCAGVLQDNPGDSTAGVHSEGASALFRACERAGVRRIVHFSAIGVDRGTVSAFSRSKLAGDNALMALDLEWFILRPSVVLGRPAYGASALIRGLAALPVLPVMPGTGPLQVVQLEEVVATVLLCLTASPSRQVLELVGPERLSFIEIVRTYRRWLGWPEQPTLTLPRWIAHGMYRIGDLVRQLGWRSPVASTAQKEMTRGAVGDSSAWIALTGITPRSLGSALTGEPASVQERRFAQLYFLKPTLFAVLCLFWILTGLISLGPGWEIGIALMQEGGAGPLSAPSVIAGAVADIGIGIGIACRPWARRALYAALAVSVFYLVAGTAVLPRLWIDPIGPMLKIFPIMALHLVAIAVLRER